MTKQEAIQEAKSEAVKRNEKIYVCYEDDYYTATAADLDDLYFGVSVILSVTPNGTVQ